MILLLVHLSLACDTAESLANLRKSAFREDYLCLARATSGGTVLEQAIPGESDENVRARYTRALALWILERGDLPIDAKQARLLSADDRRLVADGIYARAGRPSPAPDHAKVFEQQGWYHPDPHYTDGRLSPRDRANIAMMDRPPEAPPEVAPPPPPAPEGPLQEAPPEGAPPPPGGEIPPPKTGWFGCSTVEGGTLWGWLPLLGLLRRRPPQP